MLSWIKGFFLKEAAQVVTSFPRLLTFSRQLRFRRLDCYFPERRQQDLPDHLPSAVHCHAVRPNTLLTENMYEIAARYVALIFQQMDRWYPGFLDGVQPGIIKTYRFYLTFVLAQEMLFYLTLIADGHVIPQKPLVFLKSSFDVALFQQFAQEVAHQPTPFEQVSLHPTVSAYRLGRLAERTKQQVGIPPLQVANAPLGSVVALVINPLILEVVRPALVALASEYPITIVFYKTSCDIDLELTAQLSQRQPVTLMSMDLPILQTTWEPIRACQKQLVHRWKSLPHKESKEFLATHVNEIFNVHQQFLALDALLAHLRPTAVLGGFDVNKVGPLLSDLKAKYGFRLLNFQHGLKSMTHTSQYLDFDAYCMWNEASAKAIAEDGYLNPDTLHVLGNPAMDKLRKQLQEAPVTPSYDELMVWKGESPLIVAYTQPLKGYITAQIQTGFLEALLQYLEAEPDARLLIKLHPVDSDRLSEALLARKPHLRHRVLIKTALELSLWESLKAADLATSVYSTTLLEAVSVNKPAVALDFERVIAAQSLGLEQVLPVVTQPGKVCAIFRKQLSSLSGQPKQTAESNLQSPPDYEARLQRMLYTLKLLPRFVEQSADKFAEAFAD